MKAAALEQSEGAALPYGLAALPGAHVSPSVYEDDWEKVPSPDTHPSPVLPMLLGLLFMLVLLGPRDHLVPDFRRPPGRGRAPAGIPEGGAAVPREV